MHQNHWRLRWRCKRLIGWGLFQFSWRFLFDEPKTGFTLITKLSKDIFDGGNHSGNHTVRWTLHDITFHPELSGRGFSNIHCTMIWAFPCCFRFFFPEISARSRWCPCPSQMASAQVLRSGTFRHLKTLSDVGLRQLCEGTYHTLLQGLCGEVPRGWIDGEILLTVNRA